MLNVFLPFTNTFLLCRFFLAWLIPQLLQKSRINPAGATLASCFPLFRTTSNQQSIHPRPTGYAEMGLVNKFYTPKMPFFHLLACHGEASVKTEDSKGLGSRHTINPYFDAKA